MGEHTAREIAVKLRQHTQRRIREATRGVIDDGGRLKLGGGGKAGVLPPGYGGTGHADGAEPPLGDPPGAAYVLAGRPGGGHGWVPLVAGAGITLDVNPTTGAITIAATGSIQYLTWGGDDLTWGGELITWGAT